MLNRLEINSDLIERIKQTYERITTCAKTNRGRSGWFKTKSGVNKVAYYHQLCLT